jgi:hypothetical protein
VNFTDKPLKPDHRIFFAGLAVAVFITLAVAMTIAWSKQ